MAERPRHGYCCLDKEHASLLLFALEFLQMHNDTSPDMAAKAGDLKQLLESLRGNGGGWIVEAD
jgi:hypothetical protein